MSLLFYKVLHILAILFLFTVGGGVALYAANGGTKEGNKASGLIGSALDGQSLDSNEAIRKLLLDEAGLAVVPFQAFGLKEDTGWFRLSVGAVSMQDIHDAFPRVRSLLDRLS